MSGRRERCTRSPSFAHARLASPRGIHKSYLKIKLLINKHKFPRGRPVMGILRLFEGSCRSFMKAEDANEKNDAPEALGNCNAHHQRTTNPQPKLFRGRRGTGATAENVTWSARGRVKSTRLASIRQQPRRSNHAYRGAHPRRLQIVPSQDSNHRMGPIFQRHHWPQWFGKVKHPRCDLFRSRPHQHVICTRSPYFQQYISSHYISSFKMRAQNQQDLIYKRGQAGITKASVTIVFDNSDRESSPPGMENYSQITVTRQVCHCASFSSICSESRSSFSRMSR